MTTQLDQRRDQTSIQSLWPLNVDSVWLSFEKNCSDPSSGEKAVYSRILQITWDEQVLRQQFTSALPDEALPDFGQLYTKRPGRDGPGRFPGGSHTKGADAG